MRQPRPAPRADPQEPVGFADHERYEVTRNGGRAAVLVSAEDHDALLETVDVLSRADEVRALEAGLDDLSAGRTATLDDVRASVRQRGRLRP